MKDKNNDFALPGDAAKKLEAETDAFLAVVRLLTPVDDDARERILKATDAFFGLRLFS